jgi:hypothetical protein
MTAPLAACAQASALIRKYQPHAALGKWLGHHEVEVHEGQRYQTVFRFLGRDKRFSVRGRPPVWEVQSVSARFFSLPHARLVNQADPCDVRTVCCHTIAEGRTFKLISEPRAEPALRDEAA